MKIESGSRDKELRILKDNVLKLKEGIVEFLLSISGLKNEDIFVFWNKDFDNVKRIVDKIVDKELK